MHEASSSSTFPFLVRAAAREREGPPPSFVSSSPPSPEDVLPDGTLNASLVAEVIATIGVAVEA